MEIEFKEFYNVLKENLESYDGDYEKFIDYGPDLFKLLTNVLDKKGIDPQIRLKISAAIAYFVIPYDIVSEHIYGPYGYIDDVFVCAHVIQDIKNEMGYGVIERYWEGEENLQDILDLCYDKSSSILGNKTNEILEYVGLNYNFEKD